MARGLIYLPLLSNKANNFFKCTVTFTLVFLFSFSIITILSSIQIFLVFFYVAFTLRNVEEQCVAGNSQAPSSLFEHFKLKLGPCHRNDTFKIEF